MNIPLEALAVLSGTIYLEDRITPATNATVRLMRNGTITLARDSDEHGRVQFSDLPLGSYNIVANARKSAQNHNAGATNVSLTTAGVAPDFMIALAGIGQVNGQVLMSDGQTPADGATVTLTLLSDLFRGQTDQAVTDNGGRFSVGNLAIGSYRITAESRALAASYNGMLLTNRQVDTAQLVLAASGTIRGRLVRADGTNPAPAINVVLSFISRSGLPGQAVSKTDADGDFQCGMIPLGSVNLEAVAPTFNGLIRRQLTLSTNGQALDIGSIALDEEDPRVLSVSPSATAVNVAVNTQIDLFFSEALAGTSINADGIYVRSDAGIVKAHVVLLPDPTNQIMRLVRIIPNQVLKSLTVYEIIVIDGDRQDALGGVIARGPTDLMGRICILPLISRFTTIDSDPPVMLSIFPSPSAVQVDPRAVMRLSFNEPIQESNFTFTVRGPAGEMPGSTSLALRNTVLVFTPLSALDVNALYTMTLSGIRDLAGNLATNQPIVSTFATLDTLGPSIASLRLADSKPPVAESTVFLEAVLVSDEPAASVRFMRDLTQIGVATSAPYRLPTALPPNGQVIYRAIATDMYGNEGPLAELTLTILTNQPPTVSIALLDPTNGPILSSAYLTLRINGTDDSGITNFIVATSGAWRSATNIAATAGVDARFSVPPETIAGQEVTFTAQAQDNLGALSPAVSLVFAIADGTAPDLEILSPVEGAILSPRDPLNLLYLARDNSSQLSLRLALSDPLALVRTQSLKLISNQAATNVWIVPLLQAPTNGGTIHVEIVAVDSETNSVVV